MRWARLAPGSLARAGGDARLQARLRDVEGLLRYFGGEPAGAVELQREALKLGDSGPARDELFVSEVLNHLGMAQRAVGDLVGAQGSFEPALELRTRLLGPEHPGIAQVLNGLGSVHDRAGRHEEASASFSRAAAIFEQALGGANQEVALATMNAAIESAKLGRRSEAEQGFRRVVSTWESLGKDGESGLLQGLNNLAVFLFESFGSLESVALLTRADELAQKLLSPGDRMQAMVRTNLCRALVITRQPQKALPICQEIVAWEGSDLVAVENRVFALGALAAARLQLGGDAVEPAERALAHAEGHSIDPLAPFLARLVLARALGQERDSAERLRALAEVAKRDAVKLQSRVDPLAAEWLSALP